VAPLAMLVSLSQENSTPETSIVYLPFDGNGDAGWSAGTNDLSATMLNFPPSPFVPGVVSNALVFSGNSHVDINNSYQLSLSQGRRWRLLTR